MKENKENSDNLTENQEIKLETEITKDNQSTVRDNMSITKTQQLGSFKKHYLSPLQRKIREKRLNFSLRFLWGLSCSTIAFSIINSDYDWIIKLFSWILLTILADEGSGWFGYLVALFGIFLFLLGGEWETLSPLFIGALLGLLVVKHSTGFLALPFAFIVFVAPIYAATKYGEMLDSSIIAISNPDILRVSFIASAVGLGISFVRQFIVWLVSVINYFDNKKQLEGSN